MEARVKCTLYKNMFPSFYLCFTCLHYVPISTPVARRGHERNMAATSGTCRTPLFLRLLPYPNERSVICGFYAFPIDCVYTYTYTYACYSCPALSKGSARGHQKAIASIALSARVLAVQLNNKKTGGLSRLASRKFLKYVHAED